MVCSMTLKFIGRSVAKSFRRRHEKRPQWTRRIVSQLLVSCQQKSVCRVPALALQLAFEQRMAMLSSPDEKNFRQH
jgi:hypothetical protein